MPRLIRLLLLCALIASAVSTAGVVTAQSAYQDIPLVVETPRYVLDGQGLHVPGYGQNAAPGSPALPVWTTVIEVPAGTEWAIEEVGTDEQRLSVATPLPAAPATVLRLDGPLTNYNQDEIASALSVEQTPDPTIYETNALFPAQIVEAGPEGIANGKRLLPIKVYPFQYNPVIGALVYRPRIELTVHFEPAPATATLPAASQAVSRTASVPGLRIHTTERGIYRLTYAGMQAAGAPVATFNPAQLSMEYLGQPIDIEVNGGDDGSFDPGDEVLFYAEPYGGRYMTQNVYRLTWSAGAGARMATRDARPALVQPPVQTMVARTHVEADRVYYSTYTDLPRDADHFFDNPLYVLTGSPQAAVTYTLPLNNLVLSGTAVVRVRAHGGLSVPDRSPDQSLKLLLNGNALGTYAWDSSTTQLIEQAAPAQQLLAGANKLTLVAGLDQLPELAKYWVSPDWAEIVYPAHTAAQDNRLYVESVAPYAVVGDDIAARGFAAAGIQVFDVSDPRHPVRLTGARESTDGTRQSVVFARGAADSFYLSTPDAWQTPTAIELDQPSTWGTPDNAAEYIALVHRSLWDAVQPLLDHRQAEGWRVAKVDVQDVYDEFSGGRVDPQAICDFLTYAYGHWNGSNARPKYVLLVGDGHFDFKGALRPDLPNLIPPYLIAVDPFIGETAADNRYVSVDGDADFLPDMAIGRIPARTPAEVTAVVDKVLTYERTAAEGEWRQRAVFVADNSADSAGNFHAMTEQSRTRVPSPFTTSAIYYKSSPALDTAAEMKTAMRAAFDRGAIYLQWFGHAAKTFLGKDKIWELSDPAKLAASAVWPLTATYSCWAGYFVNVQASGQYGGTEQVVGEAMLLAPQRGSLADFSPTGLHVGNDLVELNKGLVDALFVKRVNRVGLAVNEAKLAYFASHSGALDVIDTQVLFGDPATRLQLSWPLYMPLLLR